MILLKLYHVVFETDYFIFYKQLHNYKLVYYIFMMVILGYVYAYLYTVNDE